MFWIRSTEVRWYLYLPVYISIVIMYLLDLVVQRPLKVLDTPILFMDFYNEQNRINLSKYYSRSRSLEFDTTCSSAAMPEWQFLLSFRGTVGGMTYEKKSQIHSGSWQFSPVLTISNELFIKLYLAIQSSHFHLSS